jgi:hypothetical protein
MLDAAAEYLLQAQEAAIKGFEAIGVRAVYP